MCEQEIADEFSHTVMHGMKLQKALTPAAGGSPVAPLARPLPPKPIAGVYISYCLLSLAVTRNVMRMNSDLIVFRVSACS